jgi:hypothetical protein
MLQHEESPIHKRFREGLEELRAITGVTRWRAPICEKYYFILEPPYGFQVTYEYEKGYWHNDIDWLTGNYFQTEEEALAKADALKQEAAKVQPFRT